MIMPIQFSTGKYVLAILVALALSGCYMKLDDKSVTSVPTVSVTTLPTLTVTPTPRTLIPTGRIQP